jgi:hypothetical protein
MRREEVMLNRLFPNARLLLQDRLKKLESANFWLNQNAPLSRGARRSSSVTRSARRCGAFTWEKNMQNKLAMKALLAATVALFASLSGCGKTSETGSTAVSQKVNQRVVLRQAKNGENPTEKLRLVQMTPDGLTEASAIIQYYGSCNSVLHHSSGFPDAGESAAKPSAGDPAKGLADRDGCTALVTYRTGGTGKGTVSEAKLLYPLDKQDSADKTAPLRPLDATLDGRKVARETQFDIDGHRFIQDVVKDENGAVTHAGRLTSSEIYDEYDLVEPQSPNPAKIDIVPGASSRAVTRHRQYVVKDGSWILALDESFFPDGVIQSQGSPDANDNMIWQNYNHDHLLLSRVTTGSYGNSVTTETFLGDGKTLGLRTVQTPYSVEIDHYVKGVMTESREFGNGLHSLSITYFVGGAKSYVQTWSRQAGAKNNPDGTIDGSQYQLTRVLFFDGKDNLTKIVILGDDHKNPKEIIVVPPGGSPYYGARTVKSFRPDGTLEKVEVYGKDSKLAKTRDFTPSQNVRESLGKFAEAPPFEQPPKLLVSESRFGRGAARGLD